MRNWFNSSINHKCQNVPYPYFKIVEGLLTNYNYSNRIVRKTIIHNWEQYPNWIKGVKLSRISLILLYTTTIQLWSYKKLLLQNKKEKSHLLVNQNFHQVQYFYIKIKTKWEYKIWSQLWLELSYNSSDQQWKQYT